MSGKLTYSQEKREEDGETRQASEEDEYEAWVEQGRRVRKSRNKLDRFFEARLDLVHCFKPSTRYNA